MDPRQRKRTKKIFGLLQKQENTRKHSGLGTMSPMELGYMRQMRLWLKLVDTWPSEVLGENVKFKIIYNKVLAPFLFIAMFAQIEYIRRYASEIHITELGNCYITVMMNFICGIRVCLAITKSYKMLAKEFVEKMHLIHHKDASDYALKIYNTVDKFCRIYIRIVTVQMLIAPIVFNIRPILLNYSSGMFSSKENRPANGTYLHGVNYIAPFDISANFRNYCFGFILDILGPFWASVCIEMIDFYLLAIACHIWGHIKILDHELRHFPRPSEGGLYAWYTHEESKEVTRKLITLINYHRKIMQFTNSCSSTFGPSLAFYFGFHQVCCCILLLECSYMSVDILIAYGPITVGIFQQLILISIAFEFLGTKSERLADSVYNLPWECMRVRERRIFLFFFCNAQKPIHIKALGLVPVGVQTMASIIKTSVSYFIMLRTFTK